LENRNAAGTVPGGLLVRAAELHEGVALVALLVEALEGGHNDLWRIHTATVSRRICRENIIGKKNDGEKLECVVKRT